MTRYFSTLLIVLAYISNSYAQPINLPDSVIVDGIYLPDKIPTKRVVCDYRMVRQPSENNSSIKGNLKGIWASDEYKEILFRTNSLTKALAEYQFYTDIVFDQDSTLHCNRPDYMEESYYALRSDSTAHELFSQYHKTFTIRRVENDRLEIIDSLGKMHSFSRMRAETNLSEIYLEVMVGSKAIENLWLKGNYSFKSKSKNFELTINENGSVNSDQNIESVDVFSYMNEDILCFRYSNDKHKTYVIKSYSEDGILLQEMKPLEEEDQPIEYLKATAKLQRN